MTVDRDLKQTCETIGVDRLRADPLDTLPIVAQLILLIGQVAVLSVFVASQATTSRSRA